MKEDKQNWIPTQGGTFQGYEPQYKEGDKWKRIYTIEQSYGSPYPSAFGGVLKQIGLMSFAQAEAIRWQFTACMESQGKKVETQIQGYEIVYEIKARKI